MLKNTLNLSGYLIQNFREGETHDLHVPPNKDESWERIPAISPNWIELTYKYIKLGQVLVQRKAYSTIDVDEIVRLDSPVPLVLEKYDWGDLTTGLPLKRDKYVYLFIGDGSDTPILENRIHKYLAKDLNGIGEQEEIVEKRRQLAKADIIQRALTVDRTEQALASLREQAKDDSFTLSNTIKTFFAELSLEMYQYFNSGSLAIATRIDELMEDANNKTIASYTDNDFAWLNYQLPGVPSLGGFIRDRFIAATQPIYSLEIEIFWELFNSSGFVEPSEVDISTAIADYT